MKWEYKAVSDYVSIGVINKLGDEGWELVLHNARTHEYLLKREAVDY